MIQIDPNSYRTELKLLSPRQLEIAYHIGQGRRTAEIARQIHCSPRTAEEHIKHIHRKLGTRSMVEVAIVAVRSGLADHPEWLQEASICVA